MSNVPSEEDKRVQSKRACSRNKSVVGWSEMVEPVAAQGTIALRSRGAHGHKHVRQNICLLDCIQSGRLEVSIRRGSRPTCATHIRNGPLSGARGSCLQEVGCPAGRSCVRTRRTTNTWPRSKKGNNLTGNNLARSSALFNGLVIKLLVFPRPGPFAQFRSRGNPPLNKLIYRCQWPAKQQSVTQIQAPRPKSDDNYWQMVQVKSPGVQPSNKLEPSGIRQYNKPKARDNKHNHVKLTPLPILKHSCVWRLWVCTGRGGPGAPR